MSTTPTKIELIRPCFECTVHEWFKVDHPLVYGVGSQFIYAETSSKAKYLYALGKGGAIKEVLFKVRTRRRSELDLVQRPLHPLAYKLSDEQVRKMKHAVGVDGRISTKFVFPRNRYVIPWDADFENLIRLGAALKCSDGQLSYYFLTELGQQIIFSFLPVLRCKLKYVQYDKQLATT